MKRPLIICVIVMLFHICMGTSVYAADAVWDESKAEPIEVNFYVPDVYEANDLEYVVTDDSRGDFKKIRIVNPKEEKDKLLREWDQYAEELQYTLNVSSEEYPGISRYIYSNVGYPVIIHDPKKVFGYEWFWIGGREQTVYNGMNENPADFLSSLKRGRITISLAREALWEFENPTLLIEEKTTGLFFEIEVKALAEGTSPLEIECALPASEYYIMLDDKFRGEEHYDQPVYDTIGQSVHSDAFVGLLGTRHHYGTNIIFDTPKATISAESPCMVKIEETPYDESEDARVRTSAYHKAQLSEFQNAAKENSELLIYDYIHADKLMKEQSSFALYKLARAYDKELPKGYYKQYLTSFEYTHIDTLLPIDVRLDNMVMLKLTGEAVPYISYESDLDLSFFLIGSMYINPENNQQVLLVEDIADRLAHSEDTTKGIVFAYPMDSDSRICGEMISAYENPEMFGYANGELDDKEYACQVLRCCSDLYQYTTIKDEWDCGIQMRFRSHTVKDISQISGEREIYDRTVCQYLPESVIKYIKYAEGTGVIVERDHSTPANSSSQWWEPLKKEPLGEIHLTEEDNATITWPEYKEPVVERKDGSEIETPPASSEKETNVEKSSVEESSTEKDTREYKTMEYVEKEPSSFNPATLVIIIIISVFALAAIIGAVVVIKAKKKGN